MYGAYRWVYRRSDCLDVNTGRDKCAIYVRTFVSKDLNPSPWEFGGTLFKLPAWC